MAVFHNPQLTIKKPVRVVKRNSDHYLVVVVEKEMDGDNFGAWLSLVDDQPTGRQELSICQWSGLEVRNEKCNIHLDGRNVTQRSADIRTWPPASYSLVVYLKRANDGYWSNGVQFRYDVVRSDRSVIPPNIFMDRMKGCQTHDAAKAALDDMNEKDLYDYKTLLACIETYVFNSGSELHKHHVSGAIEWVTKMEFHYQSAETMRAVSAALRCTSERHAELAGYALERTEMTVVKSVDDSDDQEAKASKAKLLLTALQPHVKSKDPKTIVLCKDILINSVFLTKQSSKDDLAAFLDAVSKKELHLYVWRSLCMLHFLIALLKEGEKEGVADYLLKKALQSLDTCTDAIDSEETPSLQGVADYLLKEALLDTCSDAVDSEETPGRLRVLDEGLLGALRESDARWKKTHAATDSSKIQERVRTRLDDICNHVQKHYERCKKLLLSSLWLTKLATKDDLDKFMNKHFTGPCVPSCIVPFFTAEVAVLSDNNAAKYAMSTTIHLVWGLSNEEDKEEAIRRFVCAVRHSEREKDLLEGILQPMMEVLGVKQKQRVWMLAMRVPHGTCQKPEAKGYELYDYFGCRCGCQGGGPMSMQIYDTAHRSVLDSAVKELLSKKEEKVTLREYFKAFNWLVVRWNVDEERPGSMAGCKDPVAHHVYEILDSIASDWKELTVDGGLAHAAQIVSAVLDLQTWYSSAFKASLVQCFAQIVPASVPHHLWEVAKLVAGRQASLKIDDLLKCAEALASSACASRTLWIKLEWYKAVTKDIELRSALEGVLKDAFPQPPSRSETL
mmetsp:Transcript_16649/g.38467  ORF Transcript_16649/g.38467 Transcript_16649/m.38467 type:complete len:788 (-) Transcript_16649:303-2666(-)